MKYLLRFKKSGKSAYISHNDTLEEIERIFRRAKIKMEFTKGFHSKPKMSIAQAIPLGYINRSLYVTLNTIEEYDFSRLNDFMSEGFRLLDYKKVEDNFKIKIKYYSFRVYLSRNLFDKFIEEYNKMKERFIDFEYYINKKGIYVLKYKQEYNKVYNIWKTFSDTKEDFLFYPIVYDAIWGEKIE
ncbi:hypothetical protein XO10_08035 [Marinitoga sp. 1135]|uniref:Radical SAM-linked protein n=1 Tax=Marinitoga piezophila (strain DSM 14283 / JCM 11233 / KA3) TaxID=443254 RepID=H2J503_MARPK|nr:MULTISPECIES: TIGR03936 family radical SAM-associated protein [Marinitoga]AEX86020.1 radical SAM-linked protein [Marinitoga piezophila KA3]NUU96206.1 hypothetical protein [Marinitoga sp. 1135]NUU98129.1 hypothetical protein [Marinitoga sp. 1138]